MKTTINIKKVEELINRLDKDTMQCDICKKWFNSNKTADT